MPQIHRPDLATAIRREYGIRGAQGFDTIAPEIVPVSIVDDVALEKGRHAMGSAGGAGAAGERAFVIIGALSADVLVHVHEVWVSAGAAQTLNIIAATNSTVTITPGTKHFLDRRIRGAPSALVGIGSAVAGTITGQTIWSHSLLADSPVRIPLDAYLSPEGGVPETGSTRLIVVSGLDASTIRVAWKWHEHDARPGDRVP